MEGSVVVCGNSNCIGGDVFAVALEFSKVFRKQIQGNILLEKVWTHDFTRYFSKQRLVRESSHQHLQSRANMGPIGVWDGEK